LRAVFELTYAPWDAGNGVMVSEVKRFTVDAGRNLDKMESTFTFSGAPELTAAIGIGKHPKARMSFTTAPDGTWASEWEDYPKPEAGGVGTGWVLPKGSLASLAEDEQNHLALVKVRSGEPVRYYVGAGWVHSGDFSGEGDWRDYLAAFSARVASPITVSVH
jgi:pectinesterase